MTANSDLDRIKRAIHRLGSPATPIIEPIVSEVRTPDIIGIQPADPGLQFYQNFFLMIEWTFAVPYAELEKFHLFLKNNEESIATMCLQVTNLEARYLGTWWIFGIGPKTYRTLWQFKSDQAITNLKAALRTSPNFSAKMKELRSYWAKDPGRVEQMYQPGALFSDLKQASARGGQQADALVELTLAP